MGVIQLSLEVRDLYHDAFPFRCELDYCLLRLFGLLNLSIALLKHLDLCLSHVVNLVVELLDLLVFGLQIGTAV